MANNVLNYYPDPYGEFKLGFCKVNVGEKFEIILSVFKSKTGNICCGFVNQKIEDVWTPSFSFLDKNQERIFLNDCREQVVKLMGLQDSNKEFDDRSNAIKPIPQKPLHQENYGAPYDVNQKLPF